MKKLHKIGTSILAVLAPAAALGVTLGVVATSLPKGGQDVDIDAWFKEYEQIWNDFNSSIATYKGSDITFKTNGVTKTVTQVNNTIVDNVRNTYIYYDGQTEDDPLPFISGADYDWLLEEAKKCEEKGTKCTYVIETDYLSIKIPSTSTGGSCFLKINRYGYILQEDSSDPIEGETHFEFVYSKDPYERTEFDGFDDGNDSYATESFQIKKGVQYTINFNITTAPIYIINLERYDSEKTLKLTENNSSVTGYGSSVVYYHERGAIYFYPQVTSGSIQLKFQLDENFFLGAICWTDIDV